MTTSAKLALELLANAAANQTLANLTFSQLDQLVMPTVVDKDLSTPPGSPANGALYIVASGNWGTASDKTGQLAYWLTTAGAWTFVAPALGWAVRVLDELDANGVPKVYGYTGSAWAEPESGGGGGGGSGATVCNRLINGDFSVKQADPGTSSGTVTLTAGQYGWQAASTKGFDRWKAGASGCTYSFAASGGVTTITISAGSLQQVIEGVNLQTGTHTLSWSGTAQGKIGAGSYSASGVTGSVTGGTDLAIEFGTGTLLRAQLEPGSIASAFGQRLFPEELKLCKRYFPMFRAISSGVEFISTAFAFNSTQISIAYQFEVEPRVPPTGIAISNVSDFNVNAGGGGAGPAIAVVYNSASLKAGRILATAPGAITSGGGAEFFASGTTGAYIHFTGCEL